jgi:prephenate dehydrogenase
MSGHATPPSHALIVGTGLVGTSLGLALRAQGWVVSLRDADGSALQRAEDLGAGQASDVPGDVRLVIVCVPPASTARSVCDALVEFPSAVVTDVASIKGPILAAVHGAPGHARFVGGHPLAGREVSGPGGARSDLFEGRAWVLTPNGAEPEAVELVRDTVEAIGATTLVMGAAEHDRAVALVSHVPQLMASLTAARLVDAESRSVSVAGQGLRDVTRIAASDPALWAEIVDGNVEPVLEVLEAVQRDLGTLIEGLHSRERASAVRDVLRRGNAGHARIPGKHGERARRYTDVPVVIPDEPGALARLFDLAGAEKVNIEDLSLEHSPGQPVGLATLRVLPERAESFAAALRSAGLTVHL